MAFTFILAGFLKGEELYEPEYKLINSNDDIEIREYSDIILASTRIDRSYDKIFDFIYKIDQMSLKKKKSIDLKIIKEVLGE